MTVLLLFLLLLGGSLAIFPFINKTKIIFWSFGPAMRVKVDSTSVFEYASKSDPMVLLINGWRDTIDKDVITALARAYKLNTNAHFVVADWSAYSSNPFLVPSVLATVGTGKVIGEFIDEASKAFDNVDDRKIFFKNLHVLGLTMGAHVAGSVANYLKKKNSGKIGRITAFDADGPVFTFPILLPCSFRLCKKHADFVQLIHTDVLVLGTVAPIGHADFYVNFGGPIQPGCWQNLLSEFLVDINIAACSHFKSIRYYTETIKNPQKYVGTQYKFCFPKILCKSKKAIMGAATDTNARGSFFVFTK